jgi:2-oxoglutarate ferredoxin oxidoreductase subunit beta
MEMHRRWEAEVDGDEHWTPQTVEEALAHPAEWALRRDRLPHIWCPGCGIGIALGCFVQALQEARVDLDRLCVVSGIGCTGRVAG